MYVVYHTLDAQYRFLSYKFDGGAFERICIPHCDIVQRDGVCACLNMNSDGIEDLSIDPVACMGLALHILVKYHYPVSFEGQELMNEFMTALQTYLATQQQNYPDNAESILEVLFDAYNESNGFDNATIKADFEELYQCMNGKPLEEIDEIIYAVCTLCRDHEKAGFVEGVKVGINLARLTIG